MNKRIFRTPGYQIRKFLTVVILAGGSFFICYVLTEDFTKATILAVVLGGGIFLLQSLAGTSHFELTNDGVLTYFRNKKPVKSYELPMCDVSVKETYERIKTYDKDGNRETRDERRFVLSVRRPDMAKPDEYTLNRSYAIRLRDALKPYCN